MPEVLYESNDGVATITLNRPERLNSMNAGLMAGLGSSLRNVREDPGIRCVVLTGSGRAFCAGADLGTIEGDGSHGRSQESGAVGSYINRSMDELFHPVVRSLYTLPVPTVACINGVTAGGGVGLALTCDIAIAARSASFVSTFGPKLGISPDLGTTWHLPNRIGRARAMGMAMLGDQISAEQAEGWGLIWSVVEDDQLDTAVADVVTRLKVTSPLAMTHIRSNIDGAQSNGLDEHLEVERAVQTILSEANMAEGVAAFFEKRAPVFSADRFVSSVRE